MNRAISCLTAGGLGAGMMYFLDARNSRRRRTFVRDKMIRLSHEIQDAGEVIRRDVRNRLQGLAAGDLSVLIGGKNALRGNPLRGSWSPTGRTLLGLIGGGLFLSGLRREAPTACVLGTAGLALILEGITNASIEDISHISSKAREIAEESFGHDGRSSERKRQATEPAGARG
ncbi:MAG TPA: hypothetical protein VMG10_14665 [Gemmataceae bacterium]|nr:hypothetical protein [Gemmataceae bacterium]